MCCCLLRGVRCDGSLTHIERSGNTEREERGDVTIAGGYSDGRLLCAAHATITLWSPNCCHVSGEKVQHFGSIAHGAWHPRYVETLVALPAAAAGGTLKITRVVHLHVK